MEKIKDIVETLANEYISLFFVDMESGKMSIYRMDNRPYERSQPAATNVLFQDYLEVFAFDIKEEFQDAILQYRDLSLIRSEIQGKKNFTVHLRMATEDRDISVRFIKVGYADPPEFVVVGIQDVTEQESMLRKLELIEKLKEESDKANHAKTRFLSNMSHDIRTPMNAIVGYANLAKARKDDPEFLMECIDNILKSGRHLQGLINDVLDLSRVESGKDELRPEEYSTLQLKDDVEAVLGPLVTDKNLSLTFSTPHVEHHVFLADIQKIRRITINIISNSIKFTNPGGTIEAIINEEPSDTDGFGLYCFEIRDNGIGMSEEFQSHVFDMFTRERRKGVPEAGGTGLGMAITKSYVGLMGGSLELESKENVGTTIKVHVKLEYRDLPEEEYYQLRRQPEAPVLLEKSIQDKHVLVVEDNQINSAIARITLEEMGATVDCVFDGQAAVETMEGSEDNAYDYILMDLQMPIMNGIEATKVIRSSQREYLQRVPIIALTANAFMEDIETCFEAGMNAHIAKPFYPEDLRKTLTSFDRR